MVNTNTEKNAVEIANQLAAWVQSRERMKATGEDVVHLDQQILPFKTKYVQNGAIYGANSAGMVRWFAESRLDTATPAVAPTNAEPA